MGIRVRHLTRHFKRRWERRVGHLPSVERVNELLEGATRVLPKFASAETLYRKEGTGFVAVKLLGAFWIPVSGLVVYVDEQRGAAVTVISEGHHRREENGHEGG